MSEAAPTTTAAAATPPAAKPPSQVPFIIGNEACERFSFYGMRNILTPFLVSTLLLYAPEADRAGLAKDVFHSFVIGVYFFPLLGGWLSDRFFGKYHTVMWFSLIYCAGHACLAAFDDNRSGFYFGLFLIAFGSGGISPLVVSFVGDQFTKDNKHLAKVVFDAFYWTINFGSFFASLLMPIFLRQYGASVAFGIPGILMLVATLVFWMGRRQYVRVPPTRGQDRDSFFNVAKTALLARRPGQSRPGLAVAAVGVALAIGILACWATAPSWWAPPLPVPVSRGPRARGRGDGIPPRPSTACSPCCGSSSSSPSSPPSGRSSTRRRRPGSCRATRCTSRTRPGGGRAGWSRNRPRCRRSTRCW